jgi:heptosyltransferase-2
LKKILIIKISAIGDVVMSLSMIDALKKYYGKVHITWLCGEIVKPILEQIKDINEVITINENNIFNTSKLIQIKELLKIWKKLSFKQFDKVIIGHADWRYRLLALTVFSKEKVAFRYKKNRSLPLGTRFHGVDYVQLATDEYFIKKYKLVYPNLKYIKHFSYELIDTCHKKKILLFPGGANNILNEQFLRRWDIENYKELAERLYKTGYQVIISGAKSDSWVNKYFNKNVINLVGKTDLLETISLIQQCDLVITHDSGPLHLSLYLAKKNTIALFGPVLAEARIPFGYPFAYIMRSRKFISCMPCYDGKSFANCNDNICMKNISVDDVYKTAIKILSKKVKNNEKI